MRKRFLRSLGIAFLMLGIIIIALRLSPETTQYYWQNQWSKFWGESLREKKIGIQVFEGFPSALVPQIQSSIHEAYGAKVYILPSQNLPKSAFVNVKSPRYRADTLLRFLKRNKADTIDYVIGLSHRDISTTKRDAFGQVKEPASKYQDWGVFGLGYRPGPSCMVSSYRLYREPSRLFYSRLEKVCIHEIGHNLGLAHCENPQCVMADAAEKLSTVDGVSKELCVDCRKEIGLED